MLAEFPAFLRLTPARALPQDNPRSPEKLVTAIRSIRMIEEALCVRNPTVRKDYHSYRPGGFRRSHFARAVNS